MSVDLSERVAIITGASSGLGMAIARKLASAGTKLVLAARNKPRLEALVAEFKAMNCTAIACPTDVTREAEVINMVNTAVDTFGRLDILVNSAGIVQHKPTVDVTTAEWQSIIDTNLTAVFMASREAMKVMQQQRRGRIVNIGSASALVPRADAIAYTAAKFAVSGLTHALALEGRPFGITASVLHLGLAESGLSSNSANRPPDQMMQASEVADLLHLIVSLPDTTNLFNSFMLPIGQPFLGRG